MSNITIRSDFGDSDALALALSGAGSGDYGSLNARLSTLVGGGLGAYVGFLTERTAQHGVEGGYVDASTLEIRTPSFVLDAHGALGDNGSTVEVIRILNKADGSLITFTGRFAFASLPFNQGPSSSHFDEIAVATQATAPGLAATVFSVQMSADLASGGLSGSISGYREISDLSAGPVGIGANYHLAAGLRWDGATTQVGAAAITGAEFYTLDKAAGSVRDVVAVAGLNLDASQVDAPHLADLAVQGVDVIVPHGTKPIDLDAGPGTDFVALPGASGDYVIAHTGTELTLHSKAGALGDQHYDHVERLVFSDQMIAFDADGHAGQAFRVYQAAFNRTPDKAGLSYWVAQMDHGASLGQVAQGFSASSEFRAIHGTAPTAEGLVNGFYQNVLGRAPEKAGFDYWVGALHAGSSSGAVLASISESAENVALVAPKIANGVALDLAPFL
ncbi:DUF4214 domain-containing protein [Alsobacter sp. KACC 23698]|uniref:DUF4214 domain-containing protein n=1 Tax=Alsobacter sp. KACC 23698 TaxID=3149229 RepID=A0AAU7JJJ2_9HYPH